MRGAGAAAHLLGLRTREWRGEERGSQMRALAIDDELLAVACLARRRVLAQTPPMQPDIPPKFTVPTAEFDYLKREVMIPMRDGVKLYTVIVIPEGRARTHRSS